MFCNNINEVSEDRRALILEDFQAGNSKLNIRADFAVGYGVISQIVEGVKSPDTMMLQAVNKARLRIPGVNCTQGIKKHWFVFIKDVEGGNTWRLDQVSFEEALDALGSLAEGEFPSRV